MAREKAVPFSVGVCAFNEAQNINKLLECVFGQSLSSKFVLKEVIVVASGCTDDTVDIVKKFAKKQSRVKLFIQKKRRGKAVAVNLFLKKAKTNLLILQSADTLTSDTCYKFLLENLIKPQVGLVAGQVKALDTTKTFLGFANSFKWRLHHKINLKYPRRPKVGELIAFKKIFTRIPPETAVDEASIEPLIHLQGFQIVYEPRAIIFNQGPRTLREYLSTRRRIYAGHFITKKKYAYEIITLSPLKIIPIFIQNLDFSPKYLIWAMGVAGLEFFSRAVGFIDVSLNKRVHTVWKIATTTKKLYGYE